MEKKKKEKKRRGAGVPPPGSIAVAISLELMCTVRYDCLLCEGGGGPWAPAAAAGHTPAPWMDEWTRTHHRCFLKSFILAQLGGPGGASPNSLACSCLFAT